MAAELVGGALLSAFLQVAFDRLASPQVLHFFRGRKLDEKLLSMLEIKLLSIHALADDAEQKQFTDPRVKAWLVAVKDVVLDAEDLIDEIDCEALRCKLEVESQNTANKVWNFFGTSSVSSFDKEIESRMKQILGSLEFLTSQKGDLGLRNANWLGLGSGSSLVSQKLPSTSLVVESVIYGRDDDKEMIFNWLTYNPHNHNQSFILSIVGMGGIGKTTLVQHVYNDPRIEGQFDIQAWVCVSDEFDVFKVTRTILEAITKSTDDSRDLEMIQIRLKEKLSGKKFLIILDDLWNENREKWELVQTPLNYGAEGSRIVVTTRNMKVASTVRSNKVHQLKQLQEDNCWQVFAQHAFQEGNPHLNVELKEIGMKIIEKCRGLPLALKTIGSLLYTKSSVSGWESILTSKIWDLPKEESEIIPALLLSYHHLPSHLKRCFSYCSLFPKDYEFDKERLILLWMAENFLQCPQESKSSKEVGAQYFDELLSRSFFQQSNRFEMCFIMHDLINDLAKYVSGDICFRLGIDRGKSILKTTRHFSFSTNHVQCFDGFGSLYDAKKLRTFMPTTGSIIFFQHWECKMSMLELFSKFKFLHVLSLSCCFGLTKVSESIGNLKHLRLLDLSGTDIERLPDSICFLYNLQTLKLNFCDNLEEFPINLHRLTNLCCLEFIDTNVRKMPMHLGKLKNLQVLTSFYVGKSSEFNIQQLEQLNLHGRLSIGELQNIVNPLDALAADLKNKTNIVKLQLEWNSNQHPNYSLKDREVLQNLQPSKHLKSLSISNYGGTQFPSWFFDNSLSNMVSLSLDYCKYSLCLPPLGLLPFLKHMSITGLHGIVCIDADFYGNSSSSFASLETLYFSNMKEWEEWKCIDVTGAFPCLQHLSIVQCPKLKGNLPEQLLQLKKLVIDDCKQLVAYAPRAQEIRELELRDCGKLQFDYHPSTLKWLSIIGHSMDASLLERIRHIIYDTSLEFLLVDSCPMLNISTSRCYDFLVKLEISGSCDSLTTFSLDIFPKLCWLRLRCRNLQMISQENVHHHLKHLNISGCSKFESFLGEGLSAPSLESFSIKGLQNLKSLPEHMHNLLPSLSSLSIRNCPQVKSFSNVAFPSNLKKMDLSNCSKLLASLEGALGTNTSLETLSIGNMNVESFPDESLLPLSLTSLWIYSCRDLQNLNYKGLCHLSFLEELILEDCPNLRCLPEEGLPQSISTLQILGSPLLKQSCQKPQGRDWGKIAHIHNIVIDN